MQKLTRKSRSSDTRSAPWHRLVPWLVLALVAAACGGGGPESAETTTTVASAETTVAPGGQETVDEVGGTLTVAMRRAVSSLDPHVEGTGTPLPTLMPIFDRIVHLSHEGGLIPGLSLEQNFINDGATLELVLRQGVVFHDGTPMNAEAVKFSLERPRTLETASPAHVTALAPIAEIEVIDEHTVHIHRDPDPAFDIDWSLLLARMTENIGMIVSPTATENPEFDLLPVGAGPFYVESHTAEEIVVKRFADHWEPGAAQVETIVMVQAPDIDNLVAGLRAGNYDIGQIRPEAREAVDSEPHVEVVYGPLDRIKWVVMNTSRPPLDDPNFRLALQYGLNRVEIAEVMADGLGDPTSQPYATSSIGYNEGCADYYPLEGDPERARELVAASAYADNPVVQLMVSNLQLEIEYAELMQAQYRESGIEIDIQIVEPAQWGRWYDGEFDMGLGIRGRLDPLQTLADSWILGANTNPGGFQDPSIQAGIDDIVAETDPDVRVDKIREMSCEIQASGVHLALHNDGVLWAVNTRVSGFQPPLHPYEQFRGVSVND